MVHTSFLCKYNLYSKISHHTHVTNLPLVHRFSFVISSRGVVNHVFHPNGEDEEVVAIKKGLASIFAAKLHEEGEVNISTQCKWKRFSERYLTHDEHRIKTAIYFNHASDGNSPCNRQLLSNAMTMYVGRKD